MRLSPGTAQHLPPDQRTPPPPRRRARAYRRRGRPWTTSPSIPWTLAAGPTWRPFREPGRAQVLLVHGSAAAAVGGPQPAGLHSPQGSPAVAGGARSACGNHRLPQRGAGGLVLHRAAGNIPAPGRAGRRRRRAGDGLMAGRLLRPAGPAREGHRGAPDRGGGVRPVPGRAGHRGVPRGPRFPSYRFMGFVSSFRKAGFEEVGRAGTRRHVMRLRLETSSCTPRALHEQARHRDHGRSRHGPGCFNNSTRDMRPMWKCRSACRK